MAGYDHLPIYRAAFDLAVHIETLVRQFSRSHTYTLGTERRDGSRRLLARIIEANDSRDRGTVLAHLRQELEWFTVLARLCQESGAFASTRAYLAVAEPIVGLAKQNEGWLRQTVRGRGRRADQERSGEAGQGQNRAE
jgi:hypothetical protein